MYRIYIFFGLSLKITSKAIQLFEKRSYVYIYCIGYTRNFIQKKPSIHTNNKEEEQDNSPLFDFSFNIVSFSDYLF